MLFRSYVGVVGGSAAAVPYLYEVVQPHQCVDCCHKTEHEGPCVVYVARQHLDVAGHHNGKAYAEDCGQNVEENEAGAQHDRAVVGCYLAVEALCGYAVESRNTPEACGKELTDYYCSVDNDILISCGGGEMMCETMNFVDFEKIKSAEPKWYMGYSDNTNFTFLLSTICDTAAVYGPCAELLAWSRGMRVFSIQWRC